MHFFDLEVVGTPMEVVVVEFIPERRASCQRTWKGLQGMNPDAVQGERSCIEEYKTDEKDHGRAGCMKQRQDGCKSHFVNQARRLRWFAQVK